MASVELILPPPVVAEFVGRPGGSTAGHDEVVENAVLIPLTEGYWQRARASRLLVRSKGLRARTVDTLVAQCCIDADLPLITRDTDFRHFAKWCGLKLAAGA